MQSRFANDRLLDQLVPPLAVPMLLHGAGSFTEGPVWFADPQCLLGATSRTTVILVGRRRRGQHLRPKPSHFANGNTRDRQGRLVTCEHGPGVSRTELGRPITFWPTITGKRLNSPTMSSSSRTGPSGSRIPTMD